VSYTQTNSAVGSTREARNPDDVEVFMTGPPNRPYREIGYVEAQQDSLYSTDDQAEIFRRLRESAALNGCDGVVVQSADATAGGGSVYKGTGSVAVGTLRGYRGVCIVWNGPGGRPLNLEGALGYRFGDSIDSAQKSCEDIAGSWSKGGEVPGCDRLPRGMSFAGRAELSFCDAKLCSVHVVAPFLQPTDEVVLRRWGDAKAQLTKRYGEPAEGHVSRPAACQGRVVECIASGQAEYRLGWRWREGASIQLELVSKAGDTALHVRYASPANVADRREFQGL
jgi:hypothetical protein